MIELQVIDFPADCHVLLHDFYNYEPETDFSKAKNLKYLSEDLLQCAFPDEALVIDMGWYGDLASKNGEFKISIIKNENWDYPLNEIHSKSAEEVTTILNKILDYYSQAKMETEME